MPTSVHPQDLTAHPGPAAGCEPLQAFRAGLHACLTRRADALFELADTLLSVDSFPSLPHLSLEAAHRRGWGSVYAALARAASRPSACATCWFATG